MSPARVRTGRREPRHPTGVGELRLGIGRGAHRRGNGSGAIDSEAMPSDHATPVSDVPIADAVEFPRAGRPERRRIVDSSGLDIAVAEWGDSESPPVLLAHGGFDFTETFNVFAPLLVAAGWRVVSWDQRGHGRSAWAHLYSWEADVRDGVAVLDSIGSAPIPVIGHSKGGSLLMQVAEALPHRVSHIVNLDGIPSRRNMPDVADHERRRMVAAELEDWLDHRRRVADKIRRPGTLDELARRRGRMNPRLSAEWLRYLVWVGGRHDADGWRWRIDPSLRFGGFGPWRPEWSMNRIPAIGAPFLALLATEPEVMGWGTQLSDIEPLLPSGGRVELLDGVGHFVHIEKPDLVAGLVLDHIGRPGETAGVST